MTAGDGVLGAAGVGGLGILHVPGVHPAANVAGIWDDRGEAIVDVAIGVVGMTIIALLLWWALAVPGASPDRSFVAATGALGVSAVLGWIIRERREGRGAGLDSLEVVQRGDEDPIHDLPDSRE